MLRVGQESSSPLLAVLTTYTPRSALSCTPTHLAIAWLIRNPNSSTVILGASSPEQLLDNLKSLEVVDKLTPDVMEKIEAILGNKPEAHVR